MKKSVILVMHCRWWRAKEVCLCSEISVCKWVRGCLPFTGGWFCLRFCLHKLLLPCGISACIKAFWNSQCVKSAAKWANTHWQHLTAAPFSCRTQNNKTKPLRQMRRIFAKIHLSFEGVTFLIQGVTRALRQLKTLSKNNVLTGRNSTSNLKEKRTDGSLHKRMVLVSFCDLVRPFAT